MKNKLIIIIIKVLTLLENFIYRLEIMILNVRLIPFLNKIQRVLHNIKNKILKW